jgi:hypothetical protein
VTDPFALLHDAAALTLAALWAGSAMWVYGDARRRLGGGRRAAGLLAGAITLPLAVPFLYACVRPAETVSERRERELARRLLEQERAAGERCLRCRTPVEPEFLRCPRCAEGLRRACPGCRAPLRLHWSACPHCAQPLPASDLQLVA